MEKFEIQAAHDEDENWTTSNFMKMKQAELLLEQYYSYVPPIPKLVS